MRKSIANIALLTALAAIVAFFSLSYIFIEPSDFSENENKQLRSFPTLTLSKLLDGTFTSQLHDYLSDHINLRAEMVEAKAYTELALGKRENNSVLYGNDGYLIESYPYTEENYEKIEKNLAKIEKMSKSLAQSGVSTYSAVIPRKIDVLTDKLPLCYDNSRAIGAWEHVGEEHLSLTEAFAAAESDENPLFYRTDHHWTAYGAYLAYTLLSDALDYTPLPIEEFELAPLSEEFLGTTYSTSGFFSAAAETILAPTVSESDYTTEIVDTGRSFDGLYDASYLGKKDKYSVFLSGNNAHVKIHDNTAASQDKETLLIIKDSYSHSLAPYLARHFNVELIDPRYYTGSIEKYIEENDIDRVLFLFGLDTLASANMGIK